jgi:hypothetical protein
MQGAKNTGIKFKNVTLIKIVEILESPNWATLSLQEQFAVLVIYQEACQL